MNNIVIAPYDQAWPEQFQKEAALIQQALGDNCIAIHHIGSTSIPDLAAKPIIDIMPVVRDIEHVDQANSKMKELGYEVFGEYGIFFRRFFTKHIDGQKFSHVHIYEEGNDEIERHLLYRDFMRSHPQQRDEYEQLKKALAIKCKDDMTCYLNGKYEFIEDIINQAGFKGYRLVKVAGEREWQDYHRIRREEIFPLLPGDYDENDPIYSDEKHAHCVFYLGRYIIGVVQVEFLNKEDVAIRPFAIDKKYQSQGHGEKMYLLIERWLKEKDIKRVFLHANDKAVSFYKRLGFIEADFSEEKKNPPLVPIVDMMKILA